MQPEVCKYHLPLFFVLRSFEIPFEADPRNLTNANRMVFLSPVWSLDVQAQAIKRIHRIGQTRPTRIDILVTEGTFEEDIVRREKAARGSEDEKRYSRALIEVSRVESFAVGSTSSELTRRRRALSRTDRMSGQPCSPFRSYRGKWIWRRRERTLLLWLR